MSRTGRRARGIAAGTGTALAVALAVALAIPAHVERDPVFVSPQADGSVIPAAGGDFVAARSLSDPAKRPASFRRLARRLWRNGVGEAERARLVGLYARLSSSQQRAARTMLAGLRSRAGGPSAAALRLTDRRVTSERTLVVCQGDSMRRLRASVGGARLSNAPRRNRARKRALLRLNAALRKRCRFREIQAAVNAADNGDTIVVMPGFYTEPTSRAQPHNDPRCADLVQSGSRSAPAPTFTYHARCPNDINLVAVIGRDENDRCIRCNLHIVGSGVRPEDVLLEGAANPSDPGVTDDLFEEGKGQVKTAKEIGMRFERADGAWVGNMTVRNVSEHGFYSIETDGMTFDRVKAYYAHEYGHLSFVTDHLTVQDGDFAGSSDAGVYPGASPPSRERLNSRILRNRAHHNNIGMSGSMGSSLLVEDNEFDNNSTGITLDSISRAGHPGFPQNSTVIRNNRIHANNFDTYSDKAWVPASTQSPIGVGIVFGGGNDNQVSRNHIYDNWRRGTMLISVPDILTTEPNVPRDNVKLSTSHRNRYTDNVMSRSPEGEALPNGVDFWWDELGQSNCWEGNTVPGGRLVTTPASMPNCDRFPNLGLGNPISETELVVCNFAERRPGSGCPWFEVPPKPARR